MKKIQFVEQFMTLSEDRRAVIVGLGLVLLVWIGVITKVPWPVFGWWK